MQEKYFPEAIEQHIQQDWEKRKAFQATEDNSKEKFYCLSMLPYPSGKLHMGHVRNYTIGDVIARYQTMLGKNVLQPMGWDAFGLPAENAAIQNKVAPAKWTYANIKEMRRQMKRLGFGYDWSREIATCRPEYYRWEQWFFIKLYEKNLVYKKKAIVNWDPVDQTILANEQVINGRGWRSGALVERREIPQWFLKITDYADELLKGLDQLEHWPSEVRTMQRNWIGRSEGVIIYFSLTRHLRESEGYNAEHSNAKNILEVFTSRADTLMGVTYLAIAPQHPLAKQAATTNPKLQKFLEDCQNLPVAEAALATLEKQGMPTGFYAVHPITNEQIPVWVANFVVMDYGCGAVMSVPAHDQRDFEFAQKYHLPIKQVIKPMDGSSHDFTSSAFTAYGIVMNTGHPSLDGHLSSAVQKGLIEHLTRIGKGKKIINYRLRDWGVSRQRYWGTPIPMIHCSHCGTVPVPEQDLPVILPEEIEFQGTISPLRSLPAFYQTQCPKCGENAERETDTFDTFVESSWYYARYTCSDQNFAMLDERANYWLSVDQYVGGIEHAVMHLLYARFFHKLMRDAGLVNSNEPFTRLLTQGMVLKDGIKMSKSKGNVVDPEELIAKFGADTVRLFIIFAAPPEQSLEWSDSGVEGSHRFLKRLWAFAHHHHAWLSPVNNQSLTSAALSFEQKTMRRQTHEILHQANYDMTRQQFNTVVSGSMKLLNLLQDAAKEENQTWQPIINEGFSILLRLLAPIAPHITQMLWQELGHSDLIIHAQWPQPDPEALQADAIQLSVQVNGKLRGHILITPGASDEVIKTAVLADPHIKNFIEGKEIKKIIIVPGRLVSLVVA